MTFKNLLIVFQYLYVAGMLMFSDKAQSQKTSVLNTQIEPIQYVGMIPNAKPEHSFLQKLEDFIFGENPELFSKPINLLAISRDSVWVLDQGSYTIFEYVKGKENIPNAVKKSKIEITSLVGICLFKNNLLFTDSKQCKIFEMSKDGKNIKIFSDSIDLQQPTGIVFLESKNEIWVCESKAHRISILNDKGKIIRHIGNRGNNESEFNFPTSLWKDHSENVYVVDAMNFRIQIFDNKGNNISVFGKSGDATGYFARPKGIATDSQNNIYVVDALFHTVQIFDNKGNFLYNFGKQGRNNSEFWMPNGIFIDNNDFIYIADSYNSRIQIFKLNKKLMNEN